MIKTAIIIERIDIYLGGAERSVTELAGQLTQSGIDVTILAAKGTAKSENVNILCNDHPGKRTPLKIFGKAIKKHLSENRYDIIHSTLPFDFADIYQPRGGSYKEAMLRNADSYSNPLTRNFKKLTHFTNIKRYEMIRAEKHLCRPQNKTTIAALSNYVAAAFNQHYNIPPDRIKVIANAVNLENLSSPADPDKLRENWITRLDTGETSNPVIFLFGANNFRLKGLPSLIKAVKILKQDEISKKIFFVIAGNGKTKKYKQLAENLGVSGNFLFTGALDNMPQAIKASDIMVLPTFYDPCSRFILEGLAAAKPVITTRFNGAAETFENNIHGKIIANAAECESLANAIKHFAVKENIRTSSMAIEKDNLKTDISINRHCRQMIQLYEQIIKRRDK